MQLSKSLPLLTVFLISIFVFPYSSVAEEVGHNAPRMIKEPSIGKTSINQTSQVVLTKDYQSKVNEQSH